MKTILFAFCSLLPLSYAAPETDAAPRVPVPPIQTALAPRPGPEALPERVELPDPLLASGKRAGTSSEWEKSRDEVKQLLMYYGTGAMPPAPAEMRGEVVKEQLVLDGKVRYRLVHLAFGPAAQKLSFDVGIFAPTDRGGPFPTVVFPAYSAPPGAVSQPKMPRPPEQGKGGDTLALPLGIPAAADEKKTSAPADAEKLANIHRELFQRGYALATYDYQETGEDNIARNPDGSWAFRNTRFFPAYPKYDWGLLAGWAWGISRCIDYLVTQDFVDAKRLIATGHSRIGKAVLIAGAFDERIALSAPAGNGGGGVGVYRLSGYGRGGGEGLSDMLRKYPNWFAPHLYPFASSPEKLPFDQHWFVALTAPRAFLALDGTSDPICSPRGIQASLRGAAPVYDLYHAGERIGVHLSDHAHAYTAEDWTALLDFADWQLRGKKPVQTFAVPSDAAPTKIAR